MEMDELSRRGRKRVEALHQLYVNDEIDILTLDKMLGHALREEPPFLKRLFKRRDDVRRKRYTEETIWLWQGKEFVEDGDFIVEAESKPRTADITPQYAADKQTERT
jgi:hypothetical protein